MPQFINRCLFLFRIALAEKTHCKLQLGDHFLGMLEMTLFSIFPQAETKIKKVDGGGTGRGEKNVTFTASNKWDNDAGMDKDTSTSR